MHPCLSSVRRQVHRALLCTGCLLLIVIHSTATAAQSSAAAQSPDTTQPPGVPPPIGTVLPHESTGTSVVRGDRPVGVIGHAPLQSGDIVRTDVGASAMIVLANQTVLMMLEGTELEMRGPHRVRLRDGYVTVILDNWPHMLSLAWPDNGALLTVDVPHGVVTLIAAGDYDLDVEARTPATSSALVTVHAGRAVLTPLESDLSGRDRLDLLAALSIDKGRAGLLRAGTAPRLAAAALSPHRVATDNFVKLIQSLRDFRGRAPTTSRALPDWLHRYAWLLEGHGSWVWDGEYGPTWVPRVADGWRPFTQGVWTEDSAFGQTWRGYDKWWDWVTHHHGRWRTDRFKRWTWLPGTEYGAIEVASTAGTSVAVPRHPVVASDTNPVRMGSRPSGAGAVPRTTASSTQADTDHTTSVPRVPSVPSGTTFSTATARDAEEAAVRLRRAQAEEAASIRRVQAWELENADRLRRTRAAEEYRRRLIEAGWFSNASDGAVPRYDTSSDTSSSSSSTSSTSSDTTYYSSSDDAPPRHGSSSSSSSSSGSSGSSGSRSSPSSTSSSGSSGAVPRSSGSDSGSSKAPPRHGGRP
jgi:hypothetical protein